MSTQEIIRELTKLNRDELAQVALKLHELQASCARKRGTLDGDCAPCFWPSQKLFRNLGGFSNENDLCYTDR
jgi:hypothetical protein